MAMSRAWDFLYSASLEPLQTTTAPGAAFAIDDWWPSGVGTIAAELDRAWRFDLCIANYVWFSAVLDHLPDRVLKLIDTHDVFAEREARSTAMGIDASWFSTTHAEGGAWPRPCRHRAGDPG